MSRWELKQRLVAAGVPDGDYFIVDVDSRTEDAACKELQPRGRPIRQRTPEEKAARIRGF